ncbi:MAG: SufD family Fe-S cluster assembly protein [Candidatus Obscuribacterales bacterium]|nr:SufD family Fe-S cluster assembly protein [Steroidobacteraceae bacterium]
MTALPTRKLEAFRYADIDALASVWSELALPESIEIAAQQRLQQIWLPNADEVQVRRAEIALHAGASVSIFALNTAARYGRIELDVTLHEGSDFAFDAANIGGADSTLEIVTVVRHVEPNAASRQTIRSVLGGKAAGSYLGKVAVSRGADGTDSVQSVKAMLLDRGATANAKPELEIYADDVKCAHGATVGQLDAAALFYLRSRGIDTDAARALLTQAFAAVLLERAPVDSLRERVNNAIATRLHAQKAVV